MDKNGYSDPYFELKVNGECKYKSSVKKKTLHPLWEENTIIGMPRPGETFDVVCFFFLCVLALDLVNLTKFSHFDFSYFGTVTS